VLNDRLYVFHAGTPQEFFEEQSHVMALKEGGNPLKASDWEMPVRVLKKDGSYLYENSGKGITLDMTVFEAGGKHYVCWSQRQFLPVDQGAWLYIAQIDPKAPWNLITDPVLLSMPEYGWANNHTFVDEGPFALKRDGKVYLTFSSAAVDSTYVVGMFTGDEKTMIIPPGAPVEILGMYSYEGKLGISQHSLRKIQRKIRRVGDRLMYRTRKKEITKEEAARSFIGYLNTYFFGLKGVNRLSWARWSFPVLTDPESLKTIDHYCQDTIRRILHGSCRRSRMKIPYSRLNELGYKSLLYVFHHPKMIEVIRENNLAEYEQWKKNHRVLQ
jgi:hypothetical protein